MSQVEIVSIGISESPGPAILFGQLNSWSSFSLRNWTVCPDTVKIPRERGEARCNSIRPILPCQSMPLSSLSQGCNRRSVTILIQSGNTLGKESEIATYREKRIWRVRLCPGMKFRSGTVHLSCRAIPTPTSVGVMSSQEDDYARAHSGTCRASHAVAKKDAARVVVFVNRVRACAAGNSSTVQSTHVRPRE